jgi:hypothetical protein
MSTYRHFCLLNHVRRHFGAPPGSYQFFRQSQHATAAFIGCVSQSRGASWRSQTAKYCCLFLALLSACKALGLQTIVAREGAPPNPSLKGRSNGVPPGPAGRYGVHCLPSGPGVTPLASTLAPTLGSTFKHHGAPASQFKCSVWQLSVQFRVWRLICGVCKDLGHTKQVSFGVREPRHLFACSKNPGRPFHWRFTSRQTRATALGSCVHFSWHFNARLPVKKSLVAFSGLSLGVAEAGQGGYRVWSGASLVAAGRAFLVQLGDATKKSSAA